MISTAIAFRFQHLANGEDAVRARIEAVPDERKRTRMRSLIFEGIDSPLFPGGVRAFADMLRRMEEALEGDAFLVADRRTIADAVCLPYVVRLEHLQLAWLWDDLPRVAGWYERMRETPSFAAAFTDWEDPDYLTLMEAKGTEYRPNAEAALAG